MVQKIFNFPESTSSTQTHTVTIPRFVSLTNVTVDTGTVTTSINGNEITLTLKGGAYSRRVQTGGTYTPSDTKYISEWRSSYYNEDGYSGTLDFSYETMSPYDECRENGGSHSSCKYLPTTGDKYYSGNVTKPAVDTRTYQNYYKYNVTINYTENSAPTAPFGITVPVLVKGGGTLDIAWGASTDQDGNLIGYILERSINSGYYTQIYKGSNRLFTDTITKGWNTVAYRVRAYDSEGAGSGYRTSPTRTVINNTAPTISGQDFNLGDKNLGFLITYQVNDIDTEDSLIVTERLNGSIIKTINGAPRNQNLEIEITNEKLFSLPLNSTFNTIEIKVDDQNGGIAYRRYTFRRTNTAPIINGQDEDLGQKLEPFSVDFSVSDNEGDVITVKTYLDGVQKEEYQAEDGVNNTFSIADEEADWFKLSIGQHSIKIEATDEHGATAVRNYAFTRYDDKIQFTLKNPIETDIMASKILVTPTWIIPEGAIGKIEACNNAYDEVPTWEDITSQILINRHYNFTNDTKTDEKWGINIRFTVEKGTATEQVVVNGFGGAFE